MLVCYKGRLPTKVKPIKLQLKDSALAVRAKPRRQQPENKKFLRKYISKLEELGLVKHATQSNWVPAPPVLPKKRSALYRRTADYRPGKESKVKNISSMQHLDNVIDNVRRAMAFATIDFTSGY